VAVAEGKKLLTIRGSGESRKLPRGVWGGAPETDAILNNFIAKWSKFWLLLISYFVTIKSKNVGINLLDNYMKKSFSIFDFRRMPLAAASLEIILKYRSRRLQRALVGL